MERHFLELLINKQRIGNRVGGTFTGVAYENILYEIQGLYGTSVQKNHLKNKIITLEANYSELKDAIRGMSGFSNSG